MCMVLIGLLDVFGHEAVHICSPCLHAHYSCTDRGELYCIIIHMVTLLL